MLCISPDLWSISPRSNQFVLVSRWTSNKSFHTQHMVWQKNQENGPFKYVMGWLNLKTKMHWKAKKTAVSQVPQVSARVTCCRWMATQCRHWADTDSFLDLSDFALQHNKINVCQSLHTSDWRSCPRSGLKRKVNASWISLSQTGWYSNYLPWRDGVGYYALMVYLSADSHTSK